MKNWILGIGAAFLTIGAQAQMDNSFNNSGNGLGSLFATDYQSLGVNPGNLGCNKDLGGSNFALGLLEMDFTIHSTILSKDAMRKGIASVEEGGFLKSYDDKRNAAESIAQSDVRFAFNSRWLGFSFTTKIGGVGFSLSDHLSMGLNVNELGADVLFNGALSDYFDIKYDENGNELGPNYNEDDVASAKASNPVMASQLFDGTDIGYMWYRKLSVGVGVGLIQTNLLKIYPGIGLNYLMGQGIFQLKAEDGELVAFNAFSPSFNVDYGSTHSSTTLGGSLTSIGNGLGVDLGANVVLQDKYRFSMAFTGLGAINWNGNALKADDFLVDSTGSQGFDSYNFVKEFADEVKDGSIKWSEGESETYMTPAIIRMGAGMSLSKIVTVGADFSFPLNDVPGSVDGGTLALGGALDLKVLQLTTGYIMNSDYGNSVPIGLTIDLKVYEFGFASRDLFSFFASDGNTISFSTGFLRFKF